MISAVIEFENGDVVINNSPTKKVGKIFKKGFYIATATDQGIKIKTDKLQEIHDPFPCKASLSTHKALQGFFNDGAKEKINKLGFLHKLGFLYHGKQGTGKTSLMNFFARQLVKEKDAICFYCNRNSDFAGAVSIALSIREVQDNIIVFICDEFERFAREGESEMKNFLDGNNSIDNSIVFASTNYLDRVPKTISERPSRFRIVEEVKGIEDAGIIRNILKSKNEILGETLFTKKELDTMSKDLAEVGVTLDELKNEILNKVTNTAYGLSTRKFIGFKKDDNKSTEEDSDSTFDILEHYIKSSRDWSIHTNKLLITEENAYKKEISKADKSI